MRQGYSYTCLAIWGGNSVGSLSSEGRSQKGFEEGSQKGLRRCPVMVFTGKKGFLVGFSEGVLRGGGFPEGA